MATKAGTLDGYDCILSVTEEAINAQLQTLYTTKVDTPIVAPLPDPSDKEDGLPPMVNQAPANFLINHALELHSRLPDGTVVTATGIFAHIACPVITFVDNSTVKVSLTFIADDGLSVPANKGKPSVYKAFEMDPQTGQSKYWKMDPKTNKPYVDPTTGMQVPVPGETTINGFVCSFHADIGRRDIQDIQKELLALSDSKTSSVKVSDSAKTQLQTVSSEEFMASTFFCLFSSSKIASTFELVDKDGQPLDKVKFPSLSIFMFDIGVYYNQQNKQIQDKKSTEGCPTPNNPFLFGYGISQKPQSTDKTRPGSNKDNIPLSLLPKGFRMQATQTSTDKKGSLQYCMMTYREPGKSANDLDDVAAKSAGQPPVPYLDVIRVDRKSFSGTVGYSNDCFWKFYLIPQLFSLFDNGPDSNRTTTILDNFQLPKEQTTHTQETVDSPFLYQRKHTWKTKVQEVKAEGSVPKVWMNMIFRSNLRMELSSDNRKAGFEAKPDSARHVYVTVEIEDFMMFYCDYEYDDTPWWEAGHDWKRAMFAYIESWRRYQIVFDISVSEHGLLAIKVTDSGLQEPPYLWWRAVPVSALGGLAGYPVPPNLNFQAPAMGTDSFGSESPTGYGNWVRSEANVVGLLAADNAATNVRNAMARLNVDDVNKMADGIAKMLQGSRNRIIMPAAEAFTYDGMNLDSAGNVVSAIKYNTVQGGTHIDPANPVKPSG